VVSPWQSDRIPIGCSGEEVAGLELTLWPRTSPKPAILALHDRPQKVSSLQDGASSGGCKKALEAGRRWLGPARERRF